MYLNSCLGNWFFEGTRLHRVIDVSVALNCDVVVVMELCSYGTSEDRSTTHSTTHITHKERHTSLDMNVISIEISMTGC